MEGLRAKFVERSQMQERDFPRPANALGKTKFCNSSRI